MSVALSIVFTGLCALVTDGDRTPGQILLVDAKGVGEVGGVMLPEHAPTLVASLGILANAETSRPTRIITAGAGRELVTAHAQRGGLGALPGADQIGLWDLTGSEIRIRVQGREGTGLELYRPAQGQTSWPQPPNDINDPKSWRDLRFVPSMKTLTGDGRIDPALIAPDQAASTSLPRAVAARIHLDFGRLEAGIPSQEIHRDDIFEFRGTGAEPRHRQAMTDSMRWSLEADSATVVVEIIPVAGGPIKRLVLKPSATPHSLFVSNLPAENMPHDVHHAMGTEQMAALHFGAYYKLLMNEPGDQPLPWVSQARKATGLGRPAFCGGAVFSRY